MKVSLFKVGRRLINRKEVNVLMKGGGLRLAVLVIGIR